MGLSAVLTHLLLRPSVWLFSSNPFSYRSSCRGWSACLASSCSLMCCGYSVGHHRAFQMSWWSPGRGNPRRSSAGFGSALSCPQLCKRHASRRSDGLWICFLFFLRALMFESRRFPEFLSADFLTSFASVSKRPALLPSLAQMAGDGSFYLRFWLRRDQLCQFASKSAQFLR